jgi:hypothetical protein
MGARSKDFSSAFLLETLDIQVLQENGIVIWQVCGRVPWIRFCLLVPAGTGAFTPSHVWAYAFWQSTQFGRNVRTDPNSELNGSGGALESADV